MNRISGNLWQIGADMVEVTPIGGSPIVRLPSTGIAYNHRYGSVARAGLDVCMELVLATAGLENPNHMRVNDIARDCISNCRVCLNKGPAFAYGVRSNGDGNLWAGVNWADSICSTTASLPP